MTTVYIAIGACFVLNLIIIIAFRAADRKERSLKTVNQHVKNFRGEVQSTMGRMMTQVHDCEQNISVRVEAANEVINQVAESMDMLMVHQKELSALEEVCRNYKLALEKLRTMTEQAEARILAVQAEVRSAEAVKDFVDQFRKESERLSSQLQTLKAEYVRLVASTEQDLKATAANQKEENNLMLGQFNSAIERSRVQLSDYVAAEKIEYDNICREQEETARKQLEELEEKCRESQNIISEGKASLDEFMGTVSVGLNDLIMKRDTLFNEIQEQVASTRQETESAARTLETRRDTIFTEMDNKIGEVRSSADSAFMEMSGRRDNIYKELEEKCRATVDDLDSAIRSTEDVLEAKLADKEDEVSASLVNFSDKLQEKEDEVQNKITELVATRDKTVDDVHSSIEEAQKENEKILASLGAERDEVLAGINDSMAKVKETIANDITGIDSARLDAVAFFSTRMEERKAEVTASLDDLQSRKDNLEVSFNEYLRDKDEEFKAKGQKLEEDRLSHIQRCDHALKEALDSTMASGNSYLDRVKATGDDLLKVITKGIADSEEAYRLVIETAKGKVKEAEDLLEEYEKNLRETEGKLSSENSKVTALRKTVYELQSQKEKLFGEVQELATVKSNAQNETNEAREKRISEEANYIRLKGQQKAYVEKKSQEETKPRTRMTVEEMDLDDFGPEELIDLSDDDN